MNSIEVTPNLTELKKMKLNKLKSNHTFRIFLEASIILVLVTSFFVLSKNDESASASEASTLGTTGITGLGESFYVAIRCDGNNWDGDVVESTFEREGTILGLQYSHSLYTPTDPVSGMPTSGGIHTPVTIVFSADKTFPLFYKAYDNRESFNDIRVNFFRPTIAEPEENYLEIRIQNAHICSIQGFQQHALNPDSFHVWYGLEVSFVYETITWTWGDGTVWQVEWNLGST